MRVPFNASYKYLLLRKIHFMVKSILVLKGLRYVLCKYIKIFIYLHVYH